MSEYAILRIDIRSDNALNSATQGSAHAHMTG